MVPKPISITPKVTNQASGPRPLSVPPKQTWDITASEKPKPAPKPAPSGGRPAPHNERVEKLLVRAAEVDATLAKHQRFRPRLEMLLAEKPDDWMNWSSTHVATVTESTNLHVEISNALRRLDPSKMTEECERASMSPPNLLDRLSGSNKPEFYRTRLTQLRTELQALASKARALRDNAAPDIEVLRLDTLALQVASETITEALHQVIAQNRLRTLLGSQQIALMLQQSLESTEATIVKAVGNIDHLLIDVIPNWALAAAQKH